MKSTGLAQDIARPAKSRKRRWLLVFAIVLTLTLASTVGRTAFSRWQHRRLMKDAATAAANGDLRNASLLARQAFLKNPASTAACILLAQIAEQEHSPEAIPWRQRITELDPSHSGPLIDLAAAATALGETFVAEQTLAQVRESDRDTVPYRMAAAGLAVAQRQFGEAVQHFQKAAELDPKNEEVRVNLATLQLALSDPALAAEGRATLEQLRKNPRFHQQATRALLTDARHRGDPAESLRLATDLRQLPGASMGDLLLWLDELLRTRSPEFESELRSAQALAAKDGGVIYSVMTWMNARGLAAQCVHWADSLPAPARSRMPVPLALAEAYTMAGDWKRARALVASSDWGDVDFLRFAFHARVIDETTAHARRADFRAMWEQATNSTRGNPNALSMLARLATGWGWKDEASQLWWIIARKNTGQHTALKTLYALHASDKNTRELYRVARRVFEMEPANPVAKNNVASLALLLGEDEPEAHRLAAENYRLTPTQPVLAATYAFSLHRQKRTAEGIAILKKLPPPALADPSIAACYGFLLAQNGEAAAARPFIEAADREKEKLFPEEAAMVAEALQRRP